MNYILKQTKNGCFPIIQEFESLKKAKEELYKIAKYKNGQWYTKDNFTCTIYKKQQ